MEDQEEAVPVKMKYAKTAGEIAAMQEARSRYWNSKYLITGVLKDCYSHIFGQHEPPQDLVLEQVVWAQTIPRDKPTEIYGDKSSGLRWLTETLREAMQSV